MSNYDNGFTKAQHAYENMLPPDDEQETEQARKQEARLEWEEQKAAEERDERLAQAVRDRVIPPVNMDDLLDRHALSELKENE